jgi:hypothetical protein
MSLSVVDLRLSMPSHRSQPWRAAFIVDSMLRLREHPGMTAKEPPDAQPRGKDPPEHDTALLTAALDHYWARYDGRRNRAFQVLNYYLVAAAILFTAYSSAINARNYVVAFALALAGLGLTAITALTVFFEVKAADMARPAVSELQNRIANRLELDPHVVATFQTGIIGQRRNANILTFALAALLNISALVYAVIH